MSDAAALNDLATAHEEPGIRPAPRRLHVPAPSVPTMVRAVVRAVGLVCILVVALGVAQPAPALAHGEGVSILVIPSTVKAGDEVTVMGEDLDPGEAIRLELLTAIGPVLLGEPVADAEGHLAVPVRLPADLTARTYELRGTLPTGVVVSVGVLVTGPPPAPAATEGSPAGLLAAAAVGLVLAGLVIGVARTRAPAKTPARPGRGSRARR